ncbi:unnamed protein product [Rotaria magnacalcarata]|uniref:Piezo-type mechanosensitive ion channel component n=2 Tax=Rotaria magnacalcarata TaxID=392030 RepID=A0A816YMW2_9BILA|nr:unnamed protein product [Rotaria magnacalcarata]
MQGVITVTRWILAICLLIGGILHIDIFSIIYVLLFLTIPWAFIRPTATRLRFFFILALIACITSGVFLLIIGSLHIFSVTSKGKYIFRMQCSLNMRILQHFGFILWTHTANKVLFVSSRIVDVMIFCSSLIILISSNGAANQENHRNKSSKFENTTVQTRLSNHFQSVPLRIRPIFIYFRSLLLLSIIHSCGCLVPSILSAFYFFICLGLALWWALGKHFARAYLWIIRSLQIYSLVHLLSVYVFQLPFVEQYLLETNMHLVRLFGLRFLYKRSCFTHKNDVKHNWIVYLHPFIILILYWISIYEYYRTRNYQQRLKAFLMESSLTQNNSQMTSIEISTETRQSDRFHFHTITDLFWLAPSKAILNETKLNHSDENLFYKTNSLLIALLSYILSKAYILSVISMLLWSITYHSYLTLVYLILACFLWLLPNTKYWCHFFSIFFCIYAYILLIINYVDVLNIIPEEFLWRIQDIEFLHVNDENSNYASISIYIKCTMKFIYTLLLLLPLRQKTKERSQNIKNVSTSSINLFEHIELIPPVRYVYKSPINQPISRLNQIFICIKSQWSSIHYEIYYIFYMGYARIWLFNLFFHWSRLFIMILVFILSSCTDSLPVIYRIVYMGFFLQYYLCYSINSSNLPHMHVNDAKHLIAPLQWFGLWTKSTTNITVIQLITPYLCVILGVAVLQLVRRHKSLSLSDLLHSTQICLFPNVNIQSMNDSTWNTIKYLCNYGSYRFGLELTFFASLCLIIIRMDAIALIHAILLLVCILLSRQYVRRFWKLYRIYASASAVWLYFNALGFPPILCLNSIADYSISTWFHTQIWSQIKAYLYLSADFEWRPLSEHLFFDLSLLVILAIQENNFKLEHQQTSVNEMGSNEDGKSTSYHSNIIHDVITNIKLSWGNRFASYFYCYFYWFIIAYLYIIATYQQSLFYLLILFNCFFLFWHGQTFLQRSFNQQNSFLRLLILSLLSLFLSHLFMQPLSCIVMYYASIEYRCFLIHYFHVPCSIKLFRQFYTDDCRIKISSTNIREEQNENQYRPRYCKEYFHNDSMAIVYTQNAFYCQSEYNRLIFDAIGFLLVLFFIRLLHSYSFFYVRLELQVQAELSQMGASLLSQLNWLKLIEYQQKTADELENIKARVAQIRHRRTMQKREADIDEPIYHHHAILSGDYYMFDTPESTTSLIQTDYHLIQSQNLISLLDVFDWKTPDYLNSDQLLARSSRIHDKTKEREDDVVDNGTLRQFWNASNIELNKRKVSKQETHNPSVSNTENIPHRIDLSSIMMFFQLKQNSDKIRRALDTMNSRLIIYIGQQIRTLLIITQVISDAKLYLKYPNESARIITSTVPESINDCIIKACQRSQSNHRQNNNQEMSSYSFTTKLSSSNLLSSRLGTSLDTNRKTKLIDAYTSVNMASHPTNSYSSAATQIDKNKTKMSNQKNPIFDQTPLIIDKDLENFKNNRHHIGSRTILLTFIMSKFDYLTYLTLIINFLASGAAVIWLPLLASIYFWAILTFPYPSRKFWHFVAFSSIVILVIQYNIIFISPLSKNLYIHHSLIGRLNIIANVLLLIVLSFHRIVLHQLGLWDNYRPTTRDSLINQQTSIPSNTKLVRNEIIQEIYAMFKNNDGKRDEIIENANSNALEKEISNTKQTVQVTSIATPLEIIDKIESKTYLSEEQSRNDSDEQSSFSTGDYIEKLKYLIQAVKNFYSFAIACPIVPKVDYYSSMFLCDFIVIFLIIAGHQRFSNSDSVQDNIIYRYIQGSSSIDITPILMLLIQFLLIIVDRIIYLKKHVHTKFYFLCFQFVVLHLWLVIIYPIWFQRAMPMNWAAVSIYIFKSFYFMLSSLQIRNGYPTRILGNFLTTRYSILRLLCYKLYCIIPFLYEMRVLMDWMFTPTSLSLTYYFMMEEIARNAWTQKCWRITYGRSPTKRAKNRGRCERYCIGGWILFAIIVVLWFPLVFFSVSTSLADPISIDHCEIKVRLSNYKELYQLMTNNVREPTTDEFSTDIRPLITNASFASNPREFEQADIACIHLLGHIGRQWTISFSALHQLKEELKNYMNNSRSTILQIYFDYSFIRNGQTSEQDILPTGYISTLSETHQVPLTKENAMLLLRMLTSENQKQTTIIISKLMPKFIHLLPDMIDKNSPFYPQDVRLILRREKQLLWWDISEVVTNDWKNKCSFDSQALNLITVSERAGAQSKSFNLISKLLIGNNAKLTLIGVYAGLVYVLWLTCFRKTLFSDIQLIMYHEWPFADRVEKLCEEVYLVRELGELQLEEELFAQLIFLHRSPETLIRFTRPKSISKKQEQCQNQHLHQN